LIKTKKRLLAAGLFQGERFRHRRSQEISGCSRIHSRRFLNYSCEMVATCIIERKFSVLVLPYDYGL
jgi:hypothetical protein